MPSCPTFMGFAVAARDRRVVAVAMRQSFRFFTCPANTGHCMWISNTILHSGTVRDSFAGLQLWLIAAVACSRFAANPKRSRRASRLYGSK